MPAMERMTADEILHAMTSWARSAEGRGTTALLIDSSNIFNPGSPSTWRYDIGPKKSAHERAGLRELWLVDTAASEVLIFRRSVTGAASFDAALELERDHLLTSPQLDGFELPPVELFPE